MKKLITFTLIILSFSASAQFGLKAGVSGSWFTGGDQNYSGINHNYESITAGFFAKFKHVQVELLFAQSGAKNTKEDNRTFKVYNIVIPATLKANAGNWNFQLGMYAAKVIGASNSDFFTPGVNFGWTTGKNWYWYQTIDYGLTAGIGVKWEPIFLELHYRQGLENVRRGDLGWNGQRDYSYEHCLNSAVDLSIYIPIPLK